MKWRRRIRRRRRIRSVVRRDEGSEEDGKKM